MYVTGDPQVAQIAQRHGVDWVFVDLEMLGKHDRQGHLDTVISGHTLDDVRAVRGVLDESQLLVRVNPIHADSAAEIDEVIDAGADIVMLPFFTTAREVEQFVGFVAGRAEVCLLLETPEAAENVDQIVAVEGIDRIHIGLNDLHLGLGYTFMFELLADGTVERLCRAIDGAGIPFGFGGLARLGSGDLPAESILTEHFRLGSSSVILARSFCDTRAISDLDEIDRLFATGVEAVRHHWAQLPDASEHDLAANRERVVAGVETIVRRRTGGGS